MKTIRIRAEVQSLSKKQLLEIIPPDTLERIKTNDKKPEFKVYVVGHEGTANAQELSFGGKIAKAYRYVKDMIFRIGEKLQYGTPIFQNHAGANTSEGREQIGELVGKAVKMIGDKLSAIAAVYLYPQYRKLPLDVASIEAEVEYYPRGKSGADVIDVGKITGIALGSSEVDSPAFPGATLIGAIQAFAKEQGDKSMITKEEIRDAIKEGKFKIEDIFSAEEITASEPAKKAKQTEYEHAKRVEKSLGDEREKVITLTKSIEEKDNKLKELNQQVSKTQASSLLTKATETRKFDDKQKAFIERRLGSFKSDKTGDDLQLEFDKYLDNEIREFGEYAKVMGIKVDSPEIDPVTGKPKETNKGAASDDDKGSGKDLSDPQNNDFIPES
jgi:hypothetical protein